MVKKIVRDPLFLQQKSEPATKADKQVVQDLIDKLNANRDRCVGMAANTRELYTLPGVFVLVFSKLLTYRER